MSGAGLGQIQLEIEGEGPPIVFLHGLGASSSSFQPLLDSLSDFRCIRPDLPGAGRSSVPFAKITMDSLVEAVRDVLRTVAGAPAHLVAHSMGTAVAVRVAAAAPQDVLSLTLFGPIGTPGDAARERLRDRARLVRQNGMIAVADAVAAAGLSTTTKSINPVVLAYVRESHLRQDPEGFAQSCEALAGAGGLDFRRLRVPALLVTGEDDPIAPPTAVQALADAIKSAKVRILARCGHWTPLEEPKHA